MKYLTTFLVCLFASGLAYGQDIHKAFFTLQEKGSKIEVKVRMNQEAMEGAMEADNTCAGGVDFEWCSVAYVQTHLEFMMDGYPAELNYLEGKADKEDYVITFTTNDLSGKPGSIDLKATCFQPKGGTSPESASSDYENIIEFDLFGVQKEYTLNSEKQQVAQKF